MPAEDPLYYDNYSVVGRGEVESRGTGVFVGGQVSKA